MVQFLTTSGISNAIETIIRKAENKLVLVSPYLQLSQIFLERLQNADERVNEIILIYGKDNLEKEEWKKISQLKKLKLFFYENLHAKCYFNDTMMVITSMNLYEHSIQTNREMGVLITRDEEIDSVLYDEAFLEIQEIVKNSEMKLPKKGEIVPLKSPAEKIDQISQIKQVKNGYCLRCKEIIPLNTDKPYCPDCYAIWKEFYNTNYMEFYCHECGQNYKSTINKPLCPDCFQGKL